MTFELGPALLFCPADRPERYGKALERADAVILDLEDAVTPDARPAARRALVETELDPTRVIVRVNPIESDDFDPEQTVALTPVASLTALIAVAIELTVVPEAKESCSVPRLPATSIVTVEPASVPPV